jgi:hypothetical protein
LFGIESRKAGQPVVDRRQSLAGVPVLNEGVEFKDEPETGRVVISVRLRRGKGFLARFQPPVMERTIRLDELGSFVFHRIDSQRSTLGIIEEFAARYRLNRREATLSTVEFLKSLVRRGVISIVIK